jgi:hypothetical protein
MCSQCFLVPQPKHRVTQLLRAAQQAPVPTEVQAKGPSRVSAGTGIAVIAKGQKRLTLASLMRSSLPSSPPARHQAGWAQAGPSHACGQGPAAAAPTATDAEQTCRPNTTEEGQKTTHPGLADALQPAFFTPGTSPGWMGTGRSLTRMWAGTGSGSSYCIHKHCCAKQASTPHTCTHCCHSSEELQSSSPGYSA